MKKLLPEVCTIQYGFPFDSAKFSDSNGMPLIRIRDVVRGYSETYTTEEYKSEYIVHENDLLIGMDGEFNIAKWGKTPALLNQRVCRLAPKDSIDKDYLFYFMPIALKRIEEKTPFVTVKHLSAKELNKIEIPVLSLEEQRKIAETLSKVDELIAFREQQLAKLDELVKARFVEMFGDLVAPQCEYPELKLVDICVDADDIKCGPFGTQLNRDEYKAKGVAVWEIPQINSGFSEMPTHFITEEKAVILNAYSIEPGDIAMSRKGNVGKCGLFPENLKKGIIHSDVLRIRVDKRKVDSCFMMYQLHFSEAVKRQIEMVSSGAIMAGINVTKLKQIKVRIPELENQRMFAAFVERVDQQKQTIQQSLEKLELLKKSTDAGIFWVKGWATNNLAV